MFGCRDIRKTALPLARKINKTFLLSKDANIRCLSAPSKTQQEDKLAAAKPFEEMPCLPMVPFLGSAWVYFPIIGRYSLLRRHEAAHQKRQIYGDIFREKFASFNAVLSFRPEDMETIYRNEGEYPSRGEFTCIKAYRESRRQWYKSTGLLILQGKEWHDLRSKTQKHLMKPKAIQAYLGPMQDVARDFVQRILEVRDTNKEVPEFLGDLYKWALESVAFVGLDTRLGCLDRNAPSDSDGNKMIQSVQTQFVLLNKLEGFLGNITLWKYFRTPNWRKFEKAADIFSEIAFKYIDRAWEDLKKNKANEEKDSTLLQAMLSTEGLGKDGAMVTVADMLLAGIDTTSHTVGFLLYELAKKPRQTRDSL